MYCHDSGRVGNAHKLRQPLFERLVSNGVDSTYFAPLHQSYDTDTICFVGRMDYYLNQECMFDFLRERATSASSPSSEYQAHYCGCEPLTGSEEAGATCPGSSSQDLSPFVRRSALMVAPLNIARGNRTKYRKQWQWGFPS